MSMCGESYSFDEDTHYEFRFNGTAEEWALTINSSIKNYDKEYQKFWDIYSHTSKMIGKIRSF